jgi:hypothetical protein
VVEEMQVEVEVEVVVHKRIHRKKPPKIRRTHTHTSLCLHLDTFIFTLSIDKRGTKRV